MPYGKKKVKHSKLPMSSPVQSADHRGGLGGSKNSPKLSKVSHEPMGGAKLKMEGPPHGANY